MPSALIDTSTDDDEIIAAPGTSKQIQLLGWNITADGTVVVEFKSGSTVLWKTYAMNNDTVKGGIVVPLSPDRDLFVDANTPLTIGLSDAVAVAGSIEYAIVGPSNV